MKNLITCLVVCSLSGAIFAETYVVPSGKIQTIQSAIDLALQNGDEIKVLAGAYTEQIDYMGKSIRIYSDLGAYATHIVGPTTGSGPVVTFHTKENENAVLEGFTISNSPDGAGISCISSSPTILSCRIVGNTGTDGGGFHCQDANITVDDCEIQANTSNSGGGMWMNGGSLTMSNTLVRGNVCITSGNEGGGGVYVSGTSVGIDSCHFDSNQALSDSKAQGGAIYMQQDASLSMTNSLIEQNIADMTRISGDTDSVYWARGGAIYTDYSSAIITGCTFDSNRAYMYLEDSYSHNGGDQGGTGYADGGDIYLTNLSGFQLTNCEHSLSSVHSYAHGDHNSGDYTDFVQPIARGGSVFATQSTIFLTNPDFSGCTSSHETGSNVDGTPRGDGGAIYTDTNGNATVINYTITDCSASRHGGALYSRGTANPFFSNGQFSYNAASENGGAIYSESSYPTVIGSVISSNTALSGGGVYVEGDAPNLPTIASTLFCGNLVDDLVGEIYDDGNNTFSELCGEDCNENGLPDEYDILWGLSTDCNGNSIPDECDLVNGDCDGNNIPDDCDIADGTYEDCDLNGVPDVCDPDCNLNDIPDACEIQDDPSLDCNQNGILDVCDIDGGTSEDCDSNGVPDECEPDCNMNGITDACDIAGGTSEDCDSNGVPDECDPLEDCNDNGVNDACDIANGDSTDDNGNGIPDECECPADANGDGFVNVNDLLEIVGTWGECEGCGGDVNGDGWVNVTDLLSCIDAWGACP